MKSSDAWLGIAVNPQLWRYCRHLTDDQAAALYGSSLERVSRIIGFGRKDAATCARVLGEVDLKKIKNRIRDFGQSYTTRSDSAYPDRLRDIYDPPFALFYRGGLPSGKRIISIVGSRRATPYGLTIAEAIAADLAGEGIEVVSGLAKGIDAAAHRGALKTGTTYAVMGCGLNIIYPSEHRKMASEVLLRGGLLSEYPPGTPPLKIHFPARNRIISGLANGTVIVEAPRRSGALITADFALEQGREVMAVPGPALSPASKGCHFLLKEGAALVTSASEILIVMGWGDLEQNPEPAYNHGLTEAQSRLLSMINIEPTGVDEIMAADKGRRPEETLRDLTALELKGLAVKLPGGGYGRAR